MWRWGGGRRESLGGDEGRGLARSSCGQCGSSGFARQKGRCSLLLLWREGHLENRMLVSEKKREKKSQLERDRQQDEGWIDKEGSVTSSKTPLIDPGMHIGTLILQLLQLQGQVLDFILQGLDLVNIGLDGFVKGLCQWIRRCSENALSGMHSHCIACACAGRPLWLVIQRGLGIELTDAVMMVMMVVVVRR